MLKFASARNDIVNSKRAMHDALETACEALGDHPDLIVFHTTIGHDFGEILQEAQACCQHAEIAGCTCSGVVGSDGASEKIRSLALMAIKGKNFAMAYADSIQGANSEEVATSVARELHTKMPNINMIDILASGIDIAGDRAIAGIESVFGPDVPIFGGTSSDNMRARSTYQFVGSKILERGLLLVGFADPTLHLESAVHHGSVPVGEPFKVTRAETNRIFELNGQPAWPYLMSRLGLDPQIDVGETLPVAGLGQLIPEALQEEYDNEHFIHTVFKVDSERRTFYTPAACPEGTSLCLMQRDEEMMFAGVERMMNKLTKRLKGQKPVAVFHTDCAARGRFMFNQVLKDEIVTRIQYPVCQGEPIPWLGIYGFGEFAPIAGKNRFHTQTSSIFALMREPAEAA